MSVVMTNDADGLKSALVERAGSFCEWLFPAGKRNGANYLVGSIGGEPGKSLSIRLQGEKAGLWKDYATDQGCATSRFPLRVTRPALGWDFRLNGRRIYHHKLRCLDPPPRHPNSRTK